jgi:hypothetical protein
LGLNIKRRLSMLTRTLAANTAACTLLMVLVLVASSFAQPTKTAICHATGSAANPFTFLSLPPEPLSGHFDNSGTPLAGHEDDYFASDAEIAAGECFADSGGPSPTPDPGAIPEPITMLLFGAGVAGVGYASRRIRRNKKSTADS